jgi:glycosyltransferase involved in cell wall biosynthesis
MVVREMINCTLLLRREELGKAYAALGTANPSVITDQMVERERNEILAADVVFCPSPIVKKSIVDYGFPAERCIETSYGWSSERLGTAGKIDSKNGPFTAAFVGTVDVRKGAPVLLEAWARSGIKGRLLLAGTVSPEIKDKFGHILNRSDIVQLGHVRDVGSVYRAADVFCLPTWEEGCPLVTLEAMSIGAVPIVTPMGTGGAFSEADNVGIIVPAGSIDKLADALCSLASNASRLSNMKQAVIKRAEEYKWEVVGLRRRAALIQQREIWLGSSKRPRGGLNFAQPPDA